jgi:hypothetical protein
MPNGGERTMSWVAWFSKANTTLLGRATSTRGDVGLYVGSHDPHSRLKLMPAAVTLASSEASASCCLRAVHVPDSFADASTDSYVVPYPVVVAAVRGGTWEAAQIYRQWALDPRSGAPWSRRGNLSTRAQQHLAPAWLLRAPVWIRQPGLDPAPASTRELVDGIREKFGAGDSAVTDIGLHWYSWNTEKFDHGYPGYTPKPGFSRCVAQLQRPHAGVTTRIVPYTNGRIWDPSGSLNSVPPGSTCRGRGGLDYHELDSGVNFTVMDPASPFMQLQWPAVVGNISASFNVSGVYTDQISCSHAEACYTDHATNATAWAAGSQALLAEMAAKMGPGKALISESNDQTMLGSLDAFLSIYGWQGRAQCMTVLAFQAVFGGWVVHVGDIRYPQHPRVIVGGKQRYNATELAAHRAISAQLFVSGSVMGESDSQPRRTCIT